MTESEVTIASLTSQLNETRNQLSESHNKLSEVEKNYKLLTGDHDALSSTSLEQCDELIFTLSRSQEKLQQRSVSDFIYFILHSHHIYTILRYIYIYFL